MQALERILFQLSTGPPWQHFSKPQQLNLSVLRQVEVFSASLGKPQGAREQASH